MSWITAHCVFSATKRRILMSIPTTIRPREHLITAGKMYPNAWKRIDAFRSARGSDLPNWPSWCFLPLSGFYAIVSEDAGDDQIPPHLIPDVARLGAIGTWRVTQGVYRFDPAVYDAIRNTQLTGNLPSELFYRLPEWCVYIDTPDTETVYGRQYGAWLHLEWDANTERTELRLVIDTESELLPIPIHMGNWSIADAIERMIDTTQMHATHAGIASPTRPGDIVPDMVSLVTPILSLALYLCSSNADYGENRPQRPKPKKTKRGWRLFPPEKPRTWDVAVRLGAAMRAYYQANETGQTDTHARPRPHIRRAHWHAFWTGPHDQPEQRRRILKWIPPIPVAVESTLPTTIHPLKK